MKLLIAILIFVSVLAVYVLWGRQWLKQQTWAQGFFAAIEPVEILLWSKSETILWARAKQLTGLLLTWLTFTGTIDLTPLMPFIPDQYEWYVTSAFNLLPMLITVVGSIDVKLRQDTTKPIEQVAQPDAVPGNVAAMVAPAATPQAKKPAAKRHKKRV